MKVDNDALMEKIVECWNHVNETTLLDAALMFRGEMSVIDKCRSSIGGVCHKEYLYYGNRSTTCSHSETLDVVDEHIVFRFGNRIKQSLHKTKDAHRRHNMCVVDQPKRFTRQNGIKIPFTHGYNGIRHFCKRHCSGSLNVLFLPCVSGVDAWVSFKMNANSYLLAPDKEMYDHVQVAVNEFIGSDKNERSQMCRFYLDSPVAGHPLFGLYQAGYNEAMKENAVADVDEQEEADEEEESQHSSKETDEDSDDKSEHEGVLMC